VRERLPAVDVRIGYLDHGPPHVPDVAEPGAVVVPLLLSAGYHVRVDLPEQAPDTIITAAVGPDERLSIALAQRLREAGYTGGDVVLAAAGSADPRSLDDVETAAELLASALGEPVVAAYISAGEPRLHDVRARNVSSYLLSPGVFADKVAECGAAVIAQPIGAHPVLAEIVVERYLSGRQAPKPARPS
jgi:sirohydrochlorin ferrochelatase